MFDDHHGCPLLDQVLKHAQQRAHVARMQADGGLVEHEQRPVLRAPHLACKLQPLRLAAGKRRRRLAKRQVTKPQVMQRSQPLARLLQACTRNQCLVNAHGHKLRKRVTGFTTWRSEIEGLIGSRKRNAARAAN